MDNSDIKRAGLKVTLPRLKILQLLENSAQAHLSAEEVYKQLLDEGEDVGLATVYRVLTQFEAASLVMRHNFEGGHSVFELNRGNHHDHIVCVICGRVEEFIDETIEQRQHDIAEKMGYTLEEHSLILYGKCGRDDCKARAN